MTANLSGWAVLAVGGGAAVGAWIRWALGIMLNPVFPTVPLGTAAANIIGGFLMGISMALMSHFEAMSHDHGFPRRPDDLLDLFR